MNFSKYYALQVLSYNYTSLMHSYLKSTSITRNKSLKLPKNKLIVGKKSHKYKAIVFFNQLPNELKLLTQSKTVIKNKLKKWTISKIS